MSVNINCPKCQTTISVVAELSGTKIQCPTCNATLILEFGIQTKHKTDPFPVSPVVPQQKKSQEEQKEQAIEHIGNWLDISANQLKQALEMLKKDQAYETWKIPKGDGKTFRQITAPCDLLKHVQRRILDRLLYRIPISNAAHGFIPGRSIVTNASFHLRTAQAVFNMDLKDAFPSVSAQRIKFLYVRYLKTPLQHLAETISHEVLDKAIDLLIELTTYQNALPQGGPCSGYLLNVACITLDKNVYRLLQHHGESFRYTRYADDITISAPTPINEELRKKLQNLIGECGFQINPQKCQYAERNKGKSLEVTGLILEADKVRIPPKKLEEYRIMIHNTAILPKEQITDEKRLEVQSIVAFIKMVYGKIPPRIWKPYSQYMNKVGVTYRKKDAKYLDLYPKTSAVPSEPTN